MVQRRLYITQNTLLKLRPEQAAQLTATEKHSVTAGTTYEIQSYAYADVNGDFAGHLKIALLNTTIRGLNTWFVYGLHVRIEFDGVTVYPIEDQENLYLLHVNTDTVLKRRPVDSAILPSSALYPVKQGDTFQLHSYAYADSQGDFSNHIKFALRYEADYINGWSTWFAYNQHVYIEHDGAVVYPPEPENQPLLRITAKTVFKRRPLPSAQLAPNELIPVDQWTLWKLHSYAYADAQGSFNGHIKFALKYFKDYPNGFSTWYAYAGHAQVERAGKVVYPPPKPSTPAYTGKPFKLPGNSSTFYTDQPIIPGGSFTWGDATRDGTRIPETVTIVNNIIALARQLQRARNQIGRPVQVNSWYRPPAINAAVGGVSNSQHLYGKAADLQVAGYSGRALANAVMLWWPGGVGIYSNLPEVVHLDIGPRRVWGF